MAIRPSAPALAPRRRAGTMRVDEGADMAKYLLAGNDNALSTAASVAFGDRYIGKLDSGLVTIGAGNCVGTDDAGFIEIGEPRTAEPLKLTYSGTTARLNKSNYGALTGGQTFEYSLDNGNTWQNATWQEANLPITLGPAKTLMLRGDLRCNDATYAGALCFTLAQNAITQVTGHLISVMGGQPIAPVPYMFYDTFRACTGLTSIPAGLFRGISGTPAQYMFYQTFLTCTELTAIPADLFGGIAGAPAANMFDGAFYGCTKLTLQR
jgi:hypothetical protein